jgi:two-component system, OmpR family, KDP operon response regulator KdpE
MSDPGARVLVVDDEPAIRRYLRTVLAAHGYSVFEAKNGQEALSQVVAERPDIVVLDLGLPDMDGVQVTYLLREWTPLPILILSVRDREESKIAALDAGADDYLTKPFGTGEFLARLRSALRRGAQSSVGPVYVSDDLRVDLARRVVTLAGSQVQLTPTEYELLRVLVVNSGKVLTHHYLLREVWGAGYDEEMHMLRVNISNLRRKLESDPARPHYIVTEPGVGYRLRSSLESPSLEEGINL